MKDTLKIGVGIGDFHELIVEIFDNVAYLEINRNYWGEEAVDIALNNEQAIWLRDKLNQFIEQ